MKKLEPEDIPLVGDGIFLIVCLIANKIFSDEEKEEMKEILLNRLIDQDFKEEQSYRVAKMLYNAIKGVE